MSIVHGNAIDSAPMSQQLVPHFIQGVEASAAMIVHSRMAVVDLEVGSALPLRQILGAQCPSENWDGLTDGKAPWPESP